MTHSVRPRLRLVQVVVLACLGASAACTSKNSRSRVAEHDETAADKHYSVAVGSFHNGMFEDAKLQLEMALELDPEHADSHYLRGLLLLNEGKSIVDALELQRCLLDEAAEQQRGRAQELHAEAHASFSAASKFYAPTEPGRGRAFNSMAVVSLFFHHPERAITEAREALKTQFYAERYSALANLGWAFYEKGDLVSATTELRQSVLFNPDHCVGHYRLAQVYLDSGLNEQALEEIQFVVGNERCPIQDALRIHGVAQLRLGLEPEAHEAFAACISLAPRSCLAADCRRFAEGEQHQQLSQHAPP